VQGQGGLFDGGDEPGRGEPAVAGAVEVVGQVRAGVVVGARQPILDQVEQMGQGDGLVRVQDHGQVGLHRCGDHWPNLSQEPVPG